MVKGRLLAEFKRFALCTLTVLLCGCATADKNEKSDSAAPAAKSSFDAERAFSSAARTPFSDLNLVREDLPEILKSAHQAPYAVPGDATCAGIGTEIGALDVALGADLDTPAGASNPSLLEKGAEALGTAATGALVGAVEGLIPYRSWLRRLSGADRYSRKVLAAIAAGTVRRAYLKGFGQMLGCKPPAAPLPPQPAGAPVSEVKR